MLFNWIIFEYVFENNSQNLWKFESDFKNILVSQVLLIVFEHVFENCSIKQNVCGFCL